MTRRLAVLFILLAACGKSHAQGGKIAISPRETAQFVAEGAAKGMLLSTIAAAQHEKALTLWKRLFSEDKPPHFESNRFLVYGAFPGKTAKEIASTLEKQYGIVAKVLALEYDEPWAGKLAVYCLPDRTGLVGLVRIVEQRRLDEEDQGSYDVDEDFPYVAGGPSSRTNTPADYSASEQMAAALLVKKAGRKVPEWIQSAFGRASVYRAASAKELAAEHKRAQVYLIKNKRTLRDILPGGNVLGEEAAVLRASVFEYFAYSGKTSKFLPFLEGFRIIDENNEPTFTNGLTAANLPQDRLDQFWQTWVRSLK